ncbi:hypothetical protein V6N13_148612 [Hibiscus sabdariffa]
MYQILPSINPSLPHIMVASMAASSGEWKWSLFQHMFPCNLLLQIIAIKAPTEQVGSDIVRWHGGVMHRFTVKSAYGVCSASQTLMIVLFGRLYTSIEVFNTFVFSRGLFV